MSTARVPLISLPVDRSNLMKAAAVFISLLKVAIDTPR
jgi:hypothetical protein